MGIYIIITKQKKNYKIYLYKKKCYAKKPKIMPTLTTLLEVLRLKCYLNINKRRNTEDNKLPFILVYSDNLNTVQLAFYILDNGQKVQKDEFLQKDKKWII